MNQSVMYRSNPLRIPRVAAAPGAWFAVRWSLYLFVFLIPLETFDPFGFVQVFSLAKMAGFLFGLLALTQPRLCLAPPPAAFWFFGLYVLAYGVIGAVDQPQYLTRNVMLVSTLAQNLIFFWIGSNVMREERVVRGVFLSFSISCFLLTLLGLAGMSVTERAWFEESRITVAGHELNTLGYLFALAALAVLGMTLGTFRRPTPWKWLAWAAGLLFVQQLLDTGSRGAMFCLAVGVSAFLLKPGRFWERWKTRTLVAVIGAVLTLLILSSAIAIARWKATLAGDMSSRPEIFAYSWEMFLEKPLFGWGAWNHLVELGRRTGVGLRDTHNDLLWAMTAAGVVGAIPVVIGILLLIRGALKARWSRRGVMPLVLLSAVIAMSLTVTVHKRKATWLVFSYVAASAAVASRTRRPPPVGVGKRLAARPLVRRRPPPP